MSMVEAVERSLAVAEATTLSTAHGIYNIQGMSGKKYRCFINTLIGSLGDARYVEVGVWVGSTFCSAIHGNKVTATAIDNWEGQYREWEPLFYKNLDTFKGSHAEVHVFSFILSIRH